MCKNCVYKPVLEEADNLRQRGHDVDGRYDDDDAGLASGGGGGRRRRRLEPRHADVALDGEADRQPDGRRVEHGRQEVDRREVERAPAVRHADRVRHEAAAALHQRPRVEAQVRRQRTGAADGYL